MGWRAEPFVAAEFTGTPPGRALDIGAGEGRNAIWLAGLGGRVSAVDFSAVTVDRARRLAERQGVTVDWVVADVRANSPSRASSTLVIVAYLHLVPADLSTMHGRAAQSLASRGQILAVGHDITSVDEGAGGPQTYQSR